MDLYMIRIKRILLIVLVCQIFVVIILVRKHLLNTAEDNQRVSLRHHVIRDKASGRTASKLNSHITGNNRQLGLKKSWNFVSNNKKTKYVSLNTKILRRNNGVRRNSGKGFLFRTKSSVLEKGQEITSAERPVSLREAETTTINSNGLNTYYRQEIEFKKSSHFSQNIEKNQEEQMTERPVSRRKQTSVTIATTISNGVTRSNGGVIAFNKSSHFQNIEKTQIETANIAVFEDKTKVEARHLDGPTTNNNRQDDKLKRSSNHGEQNGEETSERQVVFNDNVSIATSDNNEQKVTFKKRVVDITVEKENKKREFVKNWCRIQKARTDWESFLKPCLNNTVWSQNNYKTRLPSSASTSYISLWDTRPVGSYSRFLIQSVSADNELKSIGGDSWRIHLRGPSTIAPTVFDLDDGTYEVLFLIMEPGRYNVDIWLDYTLCNGLKDPPPYWFKSGNPQGKNQPDGILKGDKPFLIETFRPHEPQVSLDVEEDQTGLKTIPNKVNCSCPSLHWDGLGRWVKDAWKPYLEEKTRVKRRTNGKGTLIIFGDSVANHFQEGLVAGPYKEICYNAFTSCRKVYNWVYNMRGYWGDGVTSPREPVPDGKDYDHNRVLHDVREVLYEPTMDENSVLVLNWGIHFAAVVSFKAYRHLIKDFIHIIKNGETDPKTGKYRKFKGQFFWKTTTAINRHRFPNPHKDVRRFLTFPRILLYNAFATSAMCQAGIDVIDVYPISDAYPRGTVSNTDPVHYNKVVFRDVERLLFETFPPND